MPPAAAVTLLVICGLSGLEAVGPVVSNNQWTPVVNSRRVYLSPEVLAKYKQEEREAQERYDVVNINEEPEDATEVFIIQEEANFEAQKVVVAPEEVTQVKEKPIIVYPEGTIQQYGDRPPAAAQPPIQQPPVRRPPPPNPRRPRPPPPNFRRPPPQYLPALSRNAPDQRPPPPPPQRGPPPPRGPI